MKSTKTLYVFTETYPFGQGEQFFDIELKYLCEAFSNIILVPRSVGLKKRNISEDVEVDQSMLMFSKKDYLISFVRNVAFIHKLPELFFSVKRFGTSNLFKSIKTFYGYCLEGDLIATRLRQKNIRNSVLYSYWLKQTAFGLAKYKEASNYKISRAHGGDVYERNYALPFRKEIEQGLQKIYCISKQGKHYLRDHFNLNTKNIRVSYLGTRRLFPLEKTTDKTLYTVSCSNCIPLKRVDLIIDSIISYAKKNPAIQLIHYHFGSGPLLHELSQKYACDTDNYSIVFKGHVDNSILQEFYANKRPHCFLNLSSSEGLPVTIMEAISYGIPVIATNVGGVSEIVNKNTGFLLERNPTVSNVVDALEDLLFNQSQMQQTTQLFWQEHFKAETNYKKFISEVQ